MGRLQAVLLALLGAAAVIYAIKSLLKGAIDIGGKHQRFIAHYSDEPGLFAFGVLFMLVLGAGCVAAGWQMWGKGDSADDR